MGSPELKAGGPPVGQFFENGCLIEPRYERVRGRAVEVETLEL